MQQAARAENINKKEREMVRRTRAACVCIQVKIVEKKEEVDMNHHQQPLLSDFIFFVLSLSLNLSRAEQENKSRKIIVFRVWRGWLRMLDESSHLAQLWSTPLLCICKQAESTQREKKSFFVVCWSDFISWESRFAASSNKTVDIRRRRRTYLIFSLILIKLIVAQQEQHSNESESCFQTWWGNEIDSAHTVACQPSRHITPTRKCVTYTRERERRKNRQQRATPNVIPK